MKIEHIALYVSDLEAERGFFVKYFGAVSNSIYHNPATGFRSYFLSFEDGSRLEIMNSPDIPERKREGLGFVHIAFSLGSAGKVDILTEKMRNDGVKILSGPRTTGDGYYESCVADPEGNRIELTV